MSDHVTIPILGQIRPTDCPLEAPAVTAVDPWHLAASA